MRAQIVPQSTPRPFAKGTNIPEKKNNKICLKWEGTQVFSSYRNNGMLCHSLGGEVIFLMQHFLAPALDLMPCLQAQSTRALHCKQLIFLQQNTLLLEKWVYTPTVTVLAAASNQGKIIILNLVTPILLNSVVLTLML